MFNGGNVTLVRGTVSTYLGNYYVKSGILLQKWHKNFQNTCPVIVVLFAVGTGNGIDGDGWVLKTHRQ